MLSPDALTSWTAQPGTKGIQFASDDGGWVSCSYAELADQVRRVATHLQDLGASPGSVVSFTLPEPHEFIPVFFGCQLAGCVPAPVAPPPSFRDLGAAQSHLTHLLRVAQPSVVVTDDSPLAGLFHAGVAAASLHSAATTVGQALDTAPAPDPGRPLGELALLQFTSGSTSSPKGVRVSSGNLVANVNALRSWCHWQPSEVTASWLPLHHDMGLIGAMITAVISQTELVLMKPVHFIREPLRWLRCFSEQRATWTTAPSFGYEYVARKLRPDDVAGLDLSSWRSAVNGAERIDPHAAARFVALVRPCGFRPEAILGAYGLAEGTLATTGVPAWVGTPVVQVDTSSLVSGHRVQVHGRASLGTRLPAPDPRSDTQWLASCGQPLEGCQVRIVDDEGADLPEGHFGEIVHAGTSLTSGYRTLTGDGPRFAPTGRPSGDAGFLLDGHLYVVGRLGDSLKLRGRFVFAEDLDAVVATVPGMPPGRFGTLLGSLAGENVACLLVESRETAWLDDAVGALRGAVGGELGLAVFRADKGALARTTSGKPKRRALWNLLAGGAARWELAWASPGVEDKIRSLQASHGQDTSAPVAAATGRPSGGDNV